MIYFDSDYMVGAHPEVMRRLNETNMLHTVGYGRDGFTIEAERMLLDRCGLESGAVYLLEGGTQANAAVIDRLLDHNDGVIAAETAHINVHEAGAIEATGHKVLAIPTADGRLTPGAIREMLDGYYADDTRRYMVRPAMVYISFPTELGTVYSLHELEEIGSLCREYEIPLFVDGARLAYGLAASDVTLADIARISDVFYIGGTKCGALFGEAVVTRRPELLPRFDSLIKLRGATLAKGRLLGVQFIALFETGLYGQIGRHGVDMAMRLRCGFEAKGHGVYIDSPTNQQFFRLPNSTLDRLARVASFEVWGSRGAEETVVRFVTDWATSESDVDTLLSAL